MAPDEAIKEAVSRVVDGFHPARIVLFGSMARGTANENSDVDLLVVCEFRGNRRSVMLAIDRALKGLGFARDILVVTPDEFERDRMIPGTVSRYAWLEGRVLHEAA